MAPKQLARTYKPVGACKSTSAQFKEATNGWGRNALWLCAFYVLSRVDRHGRRGEVTIPVVMVETSLR